LTGLIGTFIIVVAFWSATHPAIGASGVSNAAPIVISADARRDDEVNAAAFTINLDRSALVAAPAGVVRGTGSA
jgi:hypothetical protein